jgi:antitoxin component of RelBE/YafQ-DinJ toxin-antitoxin module
MEKMTSICIKISPELKQELQKEAKELGLPMNAYIRMILSKRNENKT